MRLGKDSLRGLLLRIFQPDNRATIDRRERKYKTAFRFTAGDYLWFAKEREEAQYALFPSRYRNTHIALRGRNRNLAGNQAREIGQESVGFAIDGGDVDGKEGRRFDQELTGNIHARKKFNRIVRRAFHEIFFESSEM